MSAPYPPHTKVFAPSPSAGTSPSVPLYCRGTVISYDERTGDLTVGLDKPRIKVTRPLEDFYPVEAVVDSDDMARDYLHPSDPQIVENVASRYGRGICYTSAGDTLVAVNPFSVSGDGASLSESDGSKNNDSDGAGGGGGWDVMRNIRDRDGRGVQETAAGTGSGGKVSGRIGVLFKSS